MREWVCALSADVSPCSVSCLLTAEFSFYRPHYERVSLCTECWCVSLLSVLSVDCGILFLQTALWESEFVHWVLSADVSPCSVSCLLTAEFSFYRLHYERVSLCTECWCVSGLSVLSVDCGILFLQAALWECEFVHWVLMSRTAQCLVYWPWFSFSADSTMRVWVCILPTDASSCSVYCLLMCLPAQCIVCCYVSLLSVLSADMSPCSVYCLLMRLPAQCIVCCYVSLLSVLSADMSPCSVYCLLMRLPAQCIVCWYVSLLSVLSADMSLCSVYCLLIRLPAQRIAYWCVSLLSVLPTDALPCSVYCLLMGLPGPCLAHWHVSLLSVLHTDVSPCSMYCLLMRLPGPCLAHWHVSLLSVLHTDVSPCSVYCLLMRLPAQCTGCWYISLDMYP